MAELGIYKGETVEVLERGSAESMYTYGRKLILFSRRQREGWDVWGNEV